MDSSNKEVTAMHQQPSVPDTREPATAANDSIPVVPLRHPVRLALAIVLIVVALGAAWDVAVNERYRWDVVVSYLFAPQILAGAGLTLLLTIVSMTVGIALGTFACDHAALRQPDPEHHQPRLHLVLPRNSAAGPTDFLVQHCGTLSGDRLWASLRRTVHGSGVRERADLPLGRCSPGFVLERSCLHGRNHPGRHRLRG
ncbi:hypothetical protein ARTHRO9V_240013 [Arthrobacter sp. 9V]|nr:hypothetical protein ARTHRO9V_240013 [Arthrobacter sp. 9V]